MAAPGAMVVQGAARFTVLSPHMLRMEYTPPATAGVSGSSVGNVVEFEDRATLTVVNRLLPVPPFKWTPASAATGGVATLDTGALELTYNASAGSPPGSFTGTLGAHVCVCVLLLHVACAHLSRPAPSPGRQASRSVWSSASRRFMAPHSQAQRAHRIRKPPPWSQWYGHRHRRPLATCLAPSTRWTSRTGPRT